MTDAPRSFGPTIEDALLALGLQDALVETAVTAATDTRVWRVTYQGQMMAVRVFREEQQAVMAQEIEALRLARAQSIPVPEIITSGLVAERYPAMALTWMPGRPLAELILRQPALARRLGRAAGELLARVHRIPVDERPVIDGDWISRGVAVDPDLAVRLERLSQRRLSLLHLDYHPFNLQATGGRVTGVLDWTNACFGDPRADVARTVSILRIVAPAFVGQRGAARMTIGLFTRGFLLGYMDAGGVLEQMAPFYAWAGNFLLDDLGTKLESLPIPDPHALRKRIQGWSAYWRRRALAT